MVESAESKFKRPKLHYPLVEIFWVDIASQDDGWKDDVEELKPELIHSVGFLLKETNDHYVIAMDVASTDKKHNSRSQIPKGTVKYVNYIRNVTTSRRTRRPRSSTPSEGSPESSTV